MSNLSAEERLNRMKNILRRENAAIAEFVIELAEFDRLEQFRDRGFRSLWDFCRRELGLSETQTHYRISAARQVQDNPRLVEDIREGRLCITTLAKLSKVMTQENCAALVDEAAGKPRQEVERIVARLDPKPVPQDVTRAPVSGKVEPTQTVVLTETLSRKYMTVNREYEDLLSAVRSALSHQMPAASDVDILIECMRVALKQFEKRRGIVDQPRANREATDGDIPQSVRRAVWKRDDGKCQWRTADGQICGSTHQVEFHHRQDRAKGGLDSVENVMLLCRIHNQYAAEISHGEEYMNAIRRARLAGRSSDASRNPV